MRTHYPVETLGRILTLPPSPSVWWLVGRESVLLVVCTLRVQLLRTPDRATPCHNPTCVVSI